MLAHRLKGVNRTPSDITVTDAFSARQLKSGNTTGVAAYRIRRSRDTEGASRLRRSKISSMGAGTVLKRIILLTTALAAFASIAAAPAMAYGHMDVHHRHKIIRRIRHRRHHKVVIIHHHHALVVH
jgi:hypothetical protein